MANSNLESQLVRQEDLKLKPYRCSAGKLSIGVGRNLDDNGITKEEAYIMLRNDIESAVSELEKENLFDLHGDSEQAQIREAVLVNMVFNLGMPRFSGFKKMIAAYRVGDFDAAASEMMDSAWYSQVGDRAVELCEQMRTGEWQK